MARTISASSAATIWSSFSSPSATPARWTQKQKLYRRIVELLAENPACGLRISSSTSSRCFPKTGRSAMARRNTSDERSAPSFAACERHPRTPASILRRRARELRAAGRDVIELSSGNLDFATPDHVIAAAHAAALRGDTRYTDVDGTPELKQAVRAALLRDHGLSYGLDEIVICNGSTQALFNALLATLAPEDEVIIPHPTGRPTSIRRGWRVVRR